jgi:hypothetical protein
MSLTFIAAPLHFTGNPSKEKEASVCMVSISGESQSLSPLCLLMYRNIGVVNYISYVVLLLLHFLKRLMLYPFAVST